MSKSATGSGHAIALLDPPEVIRKKFMRATTDSNPGVDFERMGPGVANLLGILPGLQRLDRRTDALAFRRHAIRRSEEAGRRNGRVEP